MLRPYELTLDLPVSLSSDVPSTTFKVWEVLMASRDGDLERIKKLTDECPELIYAQYNYTPPIHFAVREGHTHLVAYLLDLGAHDPAYITYPFKDTLSTVADDRGFGDIVSLLHDYAGRPELCKFKGDNGSIDYGHTAETIEFQRSIAGHKLDHVTRMLDANPDLARNELLFWGEGVLARSANDPDFEMLSLLVSRGASVPKMSKWGRAYYFKHYDIAKYLMDNGMDAAHTTWHNVTLLHDMAQEGDIDKARLLLDSGAAIDVIEEEYQSTPLGLAVRWGNLVMVGFLLERGADPNRSGAAWSAPLAWAIKKGYTEIQKILEAAI